MEATLLQDARWQHFFAELFSSLSPTLEESNPEEAMKKIRLVYYEHDFSSQTNRYVSEGFETLTGYPVARSLSEPHFIVKLIATEDCEAMFSISKRVFQFLNTLSLRNRSELVLRFNYRIVRSDGEAIWVMDQIIITNFDKEGKPQLASGCMSDISHCKTQGGVMCEVELNSGERIVFKDQEDVSFSKREIELLRLIDKGLSSKEIATILKISVNTVHNHRRNMMLRVRTHSMIEVLRIARGCVNLS